MLQTKSKQKLKFKRKEKKIETLLKSIDEKTVNDEKDETLLNKPSEEQKSNSSNEKSINSITNVNQSPDQIRKFQNLSLSKVLQSIDQAIQQRKLLKITLPCKKIKWSSHIVPISKHLGLNEQNITELLQHVQNLIKKNIQHYIKQFTNKEQYLYYAKEVEVNSIDDNSVKLNVRLDLNYDDHIGEKDSFEKKDQFLHKYKNELSTMLKLHENDIQILDTRKGSIIISVLLGCGILCLAGYVCVYMSEVWSKLIKTYKAKLQSKLGHLVRQLSIQSQPQFQSQLQPQLQPGAQPQLNVESQPQPQLNIESQSQPQLNIESQPQSQLQTLYTKEEVEQKLQEIEQQYEKKLQEQFQKYQQSLYQLQNQQVIRSNEEIEGSEEHLEILISAGEMNITSWPRGSSFSV